jgi:flagellar P-ring protein precursor FlgI
MSKLTIILTALLLAIAGTLPAQAGARTVRVKDIVSYGGAGDNVIDGFGLVIGLNGTGDKDSVRANGMAKAYLEHKADNKTWERFQAEDFGGNNIAAVQIFATVNEGTTVKGTRLRATVSISDNSTSLVGGYLVLGDLNYRNVARVIATASGLLNTTQAGNGGRAQAATTATVDAVLMEDLPEMTFFESRVDENGDESRNITLQLLNPDAATATAIARAINDSDRLLGDAAREGGEMAVAVGTGRVNVTIPRDYWGRETEFRSIIERQSVNPDSVAVITINRQTNAMVISGSVRILDCTVTVGGISINVTPEGDVPAKPEGGSEVPDPTFAVGQPAAPVAELMDLMNALRLSDLQKRHVIEIIHSSGHLQGRLNYVD